MFNWLVARARGGQFVLRIDDTDQSRNVEQALLPILDGLRWLGLEWDEGPQRDGPCGPYYQSQRSARYTAAVAQLLDSGAAYRDFARTEEIQAEREAAQQAGEPFIYSRRWMADSDEQAQRWEAEGRAAVVRLKMPRDGQLVLHDLVRGDVVFDWLREQDHVIQRADGSCLYHLATVVDDYEMRISHVIRAEEHLSNTPRQVFIAQQLGYELPQFAHLPYVAEPGSKNKLSKRNFAHWAQRGQAIAERIGQAHDVATFNPVIVDFYREIGFLPDALINYLLLLGWSLDDKTEDFTRDEMIANFALERVNRAAASFDPQKLMAFQERAMGRVPMKQKVALVLPFLQAAKLVTAPPSCDTGPYVSSILTAAGERVKIAGDILDYDDFFVDDDKLSYDPKAFQKRILKPPDAQRLLAEFRDMLAATEAFDADAVDGQLHRFVEERGIKVGQIIHAVRVAITGKAVGFGLFETLAILGRERCLARLDRCLELAAAGSAEA